jgi:hypothetical protein
MQDDDGEEKIPAPLPEIKPQFFGCSAHSLIIILLTLFLTIKIGQYVYLLIVRAM